MADVEQTQKMIPFIMFEVSLGQYVCEFVFGVEKIGRLKEYNQHYSKH